eukprot:TRINITY_DN2198_c0_g1_i3.p4 TRINITY_DN2198_c0_g1~~TRINITY_DN2198_c0_g1_i3.p4  ORF type:complete len:105 (+),score=22.35 TRINITY_DN2198_c0_g1_i3:844-1158(+)
MKVSPSSRADKLRTAAADWKGMSESERSPYAATAAKNRARFEELVAADKERTRRRATSTYSAFFKENFRPAHDEAKRSGATGKDAFAQATRAANEQWRQQRRSV